jgi:hypothetical protein
MGKMKQKLQLCITSQKNAFYGLPEEVSFLHPRYKCFPFSVFVYCFSHQYSTINYFTLFYNIILHNRQQLSERTTLIFFSPLITNHSTRYSVS